MRLLTRHDDVQLTTVHRAAKVSDQHMWEYDEYSGRDEVRVPPFSSNVCKTEFLIAVLAPGIPRCTHVTVALIRLPGRCL